MLNLELGTLVVLEKKVILSSKAEDYYKELKKELVLEMNGVRLFLQTSTIGIVMVGKVRDAWKQWPKLATIKVERWTL